MKNMKLLEVLQELRTDNVNKGNLWFGGRIPGKDELEPGEEGVEEVFVGGRVAGIEQLVHCLPPVT